MHLGILQRQADDVGQARRIGVQVGDVVSIGAERAARELGVREDAASPGVVLAFEDEDGRALAEEEAGSGPVPGADGAGRVVSTRASALILRKAPRIEGFERGIGRPAERDVAEPLADQVGPLDRGDQRPSRRRRPARGTGRGSRTLASFAQASFGRQRDRQSRPIQSGVRRSLVEQSATMPRLRGRPCSVRRPCATRSRIDR